jgi:hypothetical protein
MGCVLILIQVVVCVIAVALLVLLGWLADKLSRPLVPRPERSAVLDQRQRLNRPEMREESAASTPVSKLAASAVVPGARGCSYGVCGSADV